MKSTHDADEFLQVFQRMGHYYPGSTPLKPQRLAGNAATRHRQRSRKRSKTAEWLASINLSQQETWSWPLKTLPRLTGKSTHVIITEYDLPNKLIQPHDVMLDHEGNVWYSDFGQMFLGKMDPKTGKVTQYPIPVSQAGLLARHAQSRNRQGRQSLGRRDVSERHRQVRSEDRRNSRMVDAQGVGHRRRPARPSRGRRHAGRRQGVDQEFRRRQHLSARSRVQQVRESRRAEGSAHRQAHRHLRHPFGRREQSLSARFLGRQHRASSTPRPRSRRSI